MKIVKQSIKEQTYEIIKQKILSQEYSFGDPVTISSLSEELGVSNTPIREALSRLESEGLVTSSYSSQVRVIDISEELIEETDMAVLSLLLGGYDICCLRECSGELLSLLQEACDKQCRDINKHDDQQFIKDAIAFDKCFLLATGNTKIISLFDSLAPILYMLTMYNYQQNNVNKEVNLKEHEQILEAIRTGSKEKVRKYLLHHYDKHLSK
jgi:Transcriptional regulators